MMTSLEQPYAGLRVLVTGHTGFKGSWLMFWLRALGANVSGYALPAPTQPNHLQLLNLDVPQVLDDVRHRTKFEQAVADVRPAIIFHLAAQPLVRYSYQHPVETFETNILGTVNVLEACRVSGCVRAVVIITSDKCYENQEWLWGYRENDRVGGHDPYSASKGCAELVCASYRHAERYDTTHHTLIATCRAGNVLGGGDWATDRLIPDIVRATIAGQAVQIRYPGAIRPWQHVLDPLNGYLRLGQKLLVGAIDYASAWNFGPAEEDMLAVRDIVAYAQRIWPSVRYELLDHAEQPHEAQTLKLDCAKARSQLDWKPRWQIAAALTRTFAWYREFYEHGTVRTAEDVKAYNE